jgi:hypothetical protein
VPITTNGVSLNPAHAVYSIQHYVIKFVSDLWQVVGFLQAITYENHVEMREGIDRYLPPSQQLLTATEQSMKSWVGQISFVAAITYLLLFEIYNRGLHRAGIVPLSKHVTHYCPLQPAELLRVCLGGE